MNKNISIPVILFQITAILLLSPFYCSGKGGEQDSIPGTVRIELQTTYQTITGQGMDLFLKLEKGILLSKHFCGYVGISGQFSHYSENAVVTGLEGFSREKGFYLVSDWDYFPFRKQNVFLRLESFIGLTNLIADGVLKIPEYNISESYQNSYSYFNYGLGLAAGYKRGRIAGSVFYRSSLKGYLDKGRTRPGDSDSGNYYGIGISYTIL